MPKLRNINAIVEETGVVKEDILEIVNKHPKLGSIRELMAAGGVNVILSTYEEASIKKALVPEPTE